MPKPNSRVAIELLLLGKAALSSCGLPSSFVPTCYNNGALSSQFRQVQVEKVLNKGFSQKSEPIPYIPCGGKRVLASMWFWRISTQELVRTCSGRLRLRSRNLNRPLHTMRRQASPCRHAVLGDPLLYPSFGRSKRNWWRTCRKKR